MRRLTKRGLSRIRWQELTSLPICSCHCHCYYSSRLMHSLSSCPYQTCLPWRGILVICSSTHPTRHHRRVGFLINLFPFPQTCNHWGPPINSTIPPSICTIQRLTQRLRPVVPYQVERQSPIYQPPLEHRVQKSTPNVPPERLSHFDSSVILDCRLPLLSTGTTVVHVHLTLNGQDQPPSNFSTLPPSACAST